MTNLHCKSPLDPALLADYWTEDLDVEQEDVVEEHLMACETCSRELQSLIALTGAIRSLTKKGLLRVVVSEPFVNRLKSDGLNVRQYTVRPGGGVECTITDTDDVVIAHLAADLAGAQRIDLARCDADGRERMRIRDVPITTDREGVIWTEPTDLLRSMKDEVLHVRLIAVDDARERVLGDYTFHHTASEP